MIPERQRQMIEFIRNFYEHHKRGPRNKHIAKGLGLSPQHVSELSHKLAERGLVRYEPFYPIELVEEKAS